MKGEDKFEKNNYISNTIRTYNHRYIYIQKRR